VSGIGIIVEADLWKDWRWVNEGHGVGISWAEFSALDVHVIEETTGSPEANNERTANHGLTIAVDPAVLLRHGVDVTPGEVLFVNDFSHLSNGVVGGVQSEVNGFIEDDSSSWDNALNDGHSWGNTFRVED